MSDAALTTPDAQMEKIIELLGEIKTELQTIAENTAPAETPDEEDPPGEE